MDRMHSSLQSTEQMEGTVTRFTVNSLACSSVSAEMSKAGCKIRVQTQKKEGNLEW